MSGADEYEIRVDDAQLEDLRRRLDLTRWPDALDDAGWDYGTDAGYARELARYWAHDFDWRAQEAALNALPNRRSVIDGVGIHYIHVPGKGPSPMPLVLSHGWPSSFYEFCGMAGALSDPAAHGGDPADAFDVVIPSLPGYGFSDRPTQRGMSPRRIATLWAGLMSHLGYDRFAAHGGDWGSYVTSLLGFQHADRMIGIHLSMVPQAPPSRPTSTEDAAAAKRRRARSRWRQEEGGYSAIQSTKPQTLAYGLNDSPAGTAAWIAEKWRSWSDCDGDVERAFSKDQLLTNISIYWFTETINSSVRLYAESRRDPVAVAEGDRIDVPTGFLLFHRQGVPSERRTRELYDVRRWTVSETGGHFTGLETPDLLAEELRAHFRPLRG